ncbi:UxaA family hydrolase [Plebeiibacterium sediminum]|uniref:Altronate dehydratase family protein n=1 Tax=Plebeiibacterium sediminum TaxID=2992112 RepID=A0AAE3M1X5_9BACT|nr:altronate dehydratase family protein [Plebeiobacterium sediminum]MCW3785300.1 altronate dehydratase family protein [Plebeiobacterium sediminum]
MKHLHIQPGDNVIVALEPVSAGTSFEFEGNTITVASDIPQAHKIAIAPIKKGEQIKKYGSSIGVAQEDIEVGMHVHVHNIKTGLGDILEYCYEPVEPDVKVTLEEKFFEGYERANGEVGIRNELWIIPTVGCVNGVSESIAKKFTEKCMKSGLFFDELDYFDGIYTFPHNYGCSQMGDDHVNTRETLQNIARHPNAGAVLVVGLGCENNQVSAFRETLGEYDPSRIKFITTQDLKDEIISGVDVVSELFDAMKEDRRTKQPLSKLRLGLECGGSDGFSGITANPMLGRVSDYVIHYGGTSVLTEVPEMFGAETILMNRCETKEVFQKTVDMVNDFKNYYKRHNQVIYENPSPGNKNGGITTLEDKSLGCTMKAGNSKVKDVLKHTERIKTSGLNLISAPGNDLVATTTLGMCGCQMVLFTTGRGTPFGGFIPTIKVATNTQLAERKQNWIDFNAGRLVDGVSMDDLSKEFIDLLLEIASGKKTKNEINGYREIAIFKSGVTL